MHSLDVKRSMGWDIIGVSVFCCPRMFSTRLHFLKHPNKVLSLLQKSSYPFQLDHQMRCNIGRWFYLHSKFAGFSLQAVCFISKLAAPHSFHTPVHKRTTLCAFHTSVRAHSIAHRHGRWKDTCPFSSYWAPFSLACSLPFSKILSWVGRVSPKQISMMDDLVRARYLLCKPTQVNTCVANPYFTFK